MYDVSCFLLFSFTEYVFMLAFTIKNLKAFDLKYLNSNYTGTPKKKLKKVGRDY